MGADGVVVHPGRVAVAVAAAGVGRARAVGQVMPLSVEVQVPMPWPPQPVARNMHVPLVGAGRIDNGWVAEVGAVPCAEDVATDNGPCGAAIGGAGDLCRCCCRQVIVSG